MQFNVIKFLTTINNVTVGHCYNSQARSTVLQGLPFGGIPTVLATNVVLWMVLLLVFSCLRKAAWDYGRLALLMDNDSVTSLFYGEQTDKEKSPSESSPSDVESKDVVSWMMLFLFVSRDSEIQCKSGIDATIYLSFQRHILVLLTLICVLSIGIILPVNFSGDLLGSSPQHFGRTTIANVPAEDGLLWLHSIFALIYFLMTVSCMTHHSLSCLFLKQVARTLMIAQIPKEISDPGLLTKHFHEAYPGCTVSDIQFCFDVRRLMKLESERHKAMRGRLYFTAKAQKEGKIMIRTNSCARICCCECGFAKVDAEQYYSELEEKLTDEFYAELNRISLKRLGMGFVTFQDDRMTAVIVKDYRRTRCQRRPQQSSITTVVKSHQWNVSYAPAPNNIIWENLSVQSTEWWIRCIVLNTFLFILLFFLTTPAIIVNTMDRFNVTNPIQSLKNPIVTQFFPTLLLWGFSHVLPFIVYRSAFFECHWTRSTENQVTMHKCYFFLVFMVIILPSLGLTSLDVFFRWLFDIHFLDQANIKFQCVFLPDNGAFFVNYIITSSLIGTAMELLRIPGLIVYALRLCFAKTEPEQIHVKKSQAYEYQYGLEYAWTMCSFAVVMTYSITCPLIVPFGLVYMLLKHLVDRYNIYYACVPTKLDQHIHSAAVSQVIMGPILCMFWLLFFSVLRLGKYYYISPTVSALSSLYSKHTIFCIQYVNLLYLLIFRLQMADQQSESGFTDTERSSVSSTPNSTMYIAAVLQDPEVGLTPAASPAHLSYGAMGNRVEGTKLGNTDQMQSLESDLERQQDLAPGSLMDNEIQYH
uniref:Transmembrane protein 63C n=1 Tax=Callorhinchus milii TaxID=7868 RepID=A0A4W3IQX1_CALMI